MSTFRIEEEEAEASFGLLLAHIRRGDRIVLEQKDAMIAAMPAQTAAAVDSTRGLLRHLLVRRASSPTDTAIASHPEALPAPPPSAVTSIASWLGRRNRQN
jgi:hypothetical protein